MSYCRVRTVKFHHKINVCATISIIEEIFPLSQVSQGKSSADVSLQA